MRSRSKEKLLLLLPIFVFFFGLMIFPTIYGWYLSLNRVFLHSFEFPVFTGLTNFTSVLRDPRFHSALWFTVKFTVLTTLAQLSIGMGLAILFNRDIPGKKIFTSLLLLPMMVSPALIGVMYRLLLNEFIGPLSYYTGLNLLSMAYVIGTVVVIDILQWSPFAFLILYAALQTIPKSYYEAASIEGANKLQSFVHVTLPSIKVFIIMVLVLRGIDAFKTFDMINVLTAGGPGTATTTVSIYIYKMAFQTGNIGRATAASLLMLVIFSVPLAFVLKRIRKEGAE